MSRLSFPDNSAVSFAQDASEEREHWFVVKDGRKISPAIYNYSEAVNRAKQTKGAWVENDEGEVDWQGRG